MTDVRSLRTAFLSEIERTAIRRLLNEAFDGDFSDEDWRHALGGWHAVVGPPGSVVGHAALVERRLIVGSREFAAGYVEAVAVAPTHQGTGVGTAIMTTITGMIRARCELGALSTGAWRFYERLGWERWRGPTHVRTADGRLFRSEAEDDGVMILRCAASQDIDLTASIACDERSGDSW